VCSQGQFDSIYLDLSSAFDSVLYSLLFDKLSSYGMSASYVNWFCSYLTSRRFFFRRSSLRLLVLFKVVLGPQLFNIDLNDLCSKISHGCCLLFADDIDCFRRITSVDFLLLPLH
jgi:hypothetical protein